MIHPDYAAYLEGLPPQDLRTVERALRGLGKVLAPRPHPEITPGAAAQPFLRRVAQAVRRMVRRA